MLRQLQELPRVRVKGENNISEKFKKNQKKRKKIVDIEF